MLRRNNTTPRPPVSPALAALAVAASAVGLAGCDEYLARRDAMTLGVADATETNKAIQTINRWPKAARQDRWTSDGERARTAIVRYQANKVIPPKTLGTDKGGVNEAEKVSETPVAPPSEK